MKSIRKIRSLYLVGILLLTIFVLPVPAQAHRFSLVDYVEHAHVDREIEVHGPMAISRSTIVDRQTNGDSRRSRVYHVYARIDGRWVIVFSSSRLAS